ncbi:hypothetical protein M0R45_006683 [Rubus argutus]|uniref:Uncharacterized protein n=1 Tax=Rubus argutus TaxID=59490 RepID=A0AAW1YRA6_RUBAR
MDRIMEAWVRPKLKDMFISKWRVIQHRHKYTYNTIAIPNSYIESLKSLTPQISNSKFFSQLNKLVSLNSTYAQLNHTKGLSSAFGDLLANGDEALVTQAVPFYLASLRLFEKFIASA